jgi:hypothetical protein
VSNAFQGKEKMGLATQTRLDATEEHPINPVSAVAWESRIQSGRWRMSSLHGRYQQLLVNDALLEFC